MGRIKMLAAASLLSSLAYAMPAYAAYTLYTGDAGGFVANSATPAYLAAQGTPTEFISFDTFANGTTATGDPVNGSLFSNGVTFASLGSALVNFSGAGNGSEIGPNNAGSYAGALIITLADAASAVGFGTVSPPIAVSFFDENGVLVGSYSPTSTFDFAGLVGDNGSVIKSIQLTGPFFAIQDFQYRTAVTGTVPEPMTWAMMVAGFGAMGAAMRRRAKVSTRVRFA